MSGSGLLGSKKRFPSNHRLINGLRFCPPLEPSFRPPCNNIFDAIGDTPLVKLHRIPTEENIPSDVNIWVKCEYLNPCGSIKDRIGFALMEEAKRALGDKFMRSQVVLEPTSGNTGIGIAANCAVNNYKCQLITHPKISDEKSNIIKLLGADVAILDSETDEMEKAYQLLNSDNYVMLDQFENNKNPETHYKNTATEIIEALRLEPDLKSPKVDYIFCAAGTGGTMTGLGTKLKEVYPNCKLIAAQPHGSILFGGSEKHPFLVEGVVGDKPAPYTLDMSLHDDYVDVTDMRAFTMARDMAKKEAILCGGSSGLLVQAAIDYIRKNNIMQGNVVVILPDGICNYMSKFVVDQWMEAHFFKPIPIFEDDDHKWYNAPIDDPMQPKNSLVTYLPERHKYLTEVSLDCRYDRIVSLLYDLDTDVIVVMDKSDTNDAWRGLISKESLRYKKTNPPKVPQAPPETNLKASELLTKNVNIIPLNYIAPKDGHDKGTWNVGWVTRMLDVSRYVVLGTADIPEDAADWNECRYIKNFQPAYVVSSEDVMDFIYKSKHPKPETNLTTRNVGIELRVCIDCRAVPAKSQAGTSYKLGEKMPCLGQPSQQLPTQKNKKRTRTSSCQERPC